VDWSLGTGRVPKPFTPLPSAEILGALDGPEPFVLFETSRVTASGQRSLLFTDPVGVVKADRPEEMEGCLGALEEALDRGLWAAGYLSYEAGSCFEPSLRVRRSRRFPLLWLALFRRPFLFDHSTGLFSPPLSFAPGGEGPWREFTITDLRLNVTKEDYRRAVESIRERIAAGDTYQVNFTMKYRFGFEGSTAGLYLCLRDSQPVPYAAFLRTGERDILSSSPELFFNLRKGEITARPMKGTAARGRNGKEDLRRSIALATDGKNRAENIMIVDLLRNDLGRICRPGSIEVADLCRVEPYDTLFQMTSTVRGRLRRGTSPGGILKALFPCGSVTGAPKIRTMEIISRLEAEERGVYCGAVGYFSPEGEAAFSVPIRTAVIEGDRGEMGVGSGIVADSDSEEEYEECLLKGAFLTRPRPALRLIETLRWGPGEGFRYLEDHLARLFSSAVSLGFACPVPQVRRSLEEAAAPLGPEGPWRVRLLLGRGGDCKITARPLDPPPPGTPRIRLSTVATDSSDPYLSHKTTRRELYDRELTAAREEGYFEVLFTNERGELTEGAFTSFFLKREDLLFTPPLACGLLDGILRRRLLRERGEEVREEVLYPSDLAGADAILAGNSVRGLFEVRLAGGVKRGPP
jgi:para-aminobenzoate synthetase/4-amino-4-deoxychorismate lyase